MLDSIKRKLELIRCFLISLRYLQFQQIGLFHRGYYLACNPDLGLFSRIPLIHYLYVGWKEGRRPNVFFSPSYYLQQCPELVQKRREPLLHYCQKGWLEGKLPSKLFLPDYYTRQQPQLTEPVGNQLIHYLEKGIVQGRRPSPYIDLQYYRHHYSDVPTGAQSALDHLVTVGVKENRRPGPYFDTSWYVDKTTNLHCCADDALNHYLEQGTKNGKSPLPLFDPQFYGRNNPEIAKSTIDLFAHYFRYGLPKDEKPSSFFDPQFYRKEYSDVDLSGMSPLHHYLEIGVFEGRYPDRRVKSLADKPVISIIVPVYNVQQSLLNNCIRSVLYQSYPYWQLCLADDCSNDPDVRKTLKKWSSRDNRIKTIFLDSNHGISGATNSAAALATGEFLAFLDNDDELTPDCLYEIADCLGRTGADLIYTDEELINNDSQRTAVFYKPDFNRELLLGHNYITHLVVAEKKLFEKTGGLVTQYDGAQDFDLCLKLSEKAHTIVHLDKVLYRWRASESSTSIDHSQKTYADEAGRKALIDVMNRNNIKGDVEATKWKFYYRFRREIETTPLVSILVNCRGDHKTIEKSLGSLFAKTTYPNVECICLLPAGLIEDLSKTLQSYQNNLLLLEKEPDEPSASFFNRGVKTSRGDYLIFISGWLQPLSTDWVDALMEYGQKEKTGFVGGRIFQHNSDGETNLTIPDISNPDPYYFANFFQSSSCHMNSLECAQEVLTTTPDLSLCTRPTFLELGGFDSAEFPELLFMHDLCLRLGQQGYMNFYTPYCEAQHVTKDTTFRQDKMMSEFKKEQEGFQRKWRVLLEKGDPYWNNSLLNEHGIDNSKFLTWYTGD